MATLIIVSLVALILGGGAFLVWLVLTKGFQAFSGQKETPDALETPQDFLDELHGTKPNTDNGEALPSYVTDDDAGFLDRAPRRRKVVICAITEWSDGTTLAGCDVDGANVLDRILERWGVPAPERAAILTRYWNDADACFRIVWGGDSEIRVLRNASATCAAARAALRWLVTGLTEISRSWWYQSSHGTQTPSQTEQDGLDECWVMYDHDWDKPITWFIDNIIADARKLLKKGQSLKILSDTCHSADMLRESGNARRSGMAALIRYKPAPAHLVAQRTAQAKGWFWEAPEEENTVLAAACKADNVAFSQKYSLGASKSRYEGAFTHELLQEERIAPTGTLRRLHEIVSARLAAGKNKQEPQLEGAEYLKDEALFA